MIKNLEDLLNNLKQFDGIADDSRDVKNGFIFVAIKGLGSNGHSFVNAAIKNGAKIIVGQEDICGLDVPYIKTADSRKALGKIASAWFGNPSQKLKIIGVTGTKGKTTTCHIIYHILTSLGKKSGLISSISVPGLHVTSPDVIYLHKKLKEFVDDGCKFAVIEVSSHGIDQERIAGVKFDVGVLTNIAPEHLDYHKTFEEYKRVKMSFINSCKKSVIAPKTTKLDILPGVYNNLNAEAAIEAVNEFGISKINALDAVKTFKLPEGRLTIVPNNLGINIFIDFAHTPESLAAALGYLKTLTKGRLIAVFGAAGERDPYKRPNMGREAAKFSDLIILTSEDPRSEDPNVIMNQIRSGIPDDYINVQELADRSEAIKTAIRLARAGDTIGIFGKGHEKSMNLDGKTEIPWSDKDVVAKYI